VRRMARSLALVAAATLVVTGCGRGEDGGGSDEPETAEPVEVEFPQLNEPNFKACMVSDSGGFDDKSFNQTAKAGLDGASEDFKVQQSAVQSKADADYVPNLAALVRQKCNEITTVGFLLGDATLASAQKNPNIDYAIVDFAYSDPETGENTAPDNLKGLIFDTASPSFMAGYLAAAQSESGFVGTLGGAPIPTVTIFMDGFWEGVQYYNEQKDADVKVVGWDETTQKGSFTGDFEAKGKAQTTAASLIQQGADVIFPVAGPAGLGALQAAKEADAKAIWVDTDGCVSAAEYCDILLTSVVKGMDVAVQKAIQESVEGKFTNEPYVGTLDNGGVGIAPYHDLESEISDETKTEIDEIRAKLLDGEIEIKSKAVPKS
jgi:basic membrane protein A and related proteins